jgi:hypothetical protein
MSEEYFGKFWKILEGISPNIHPEEEIKLQTNINHRRGKACLQFDLRKTPSHLRKAREQTLRCQGVKFFNNLSKDIRNITETTTENFKNMLDCHLKSRMNDPSSSTVHSSWQRTNQTNSHHPSSSPSSPSPSGIELREQHTALPPINHTPGNANLPETRGLTATQQTTRST